MPEPKSGVLPLDDAPKPVTKILFVKNAPKKSVAVYSGNVLICQDFFAVTVSYLTRSAALATKVANQGKRRFLN